MKPSFRCAFCFSICSALLLAGSPVAHSTPVVLNTNLQIRLVINTTNSSGSSSVRLRKDPRDNRLYYLKLNGDIYRVNVQPGTGSTSTKVYGAANHGLANNVQGMAIGPDGTIYLVGNDTPNNTTTYARIAKGVPNAGVWI